MQEGPKIIVNDQYRFLQPITSNVYKGLDIIQNNFVAIKIEKVSR